MRCATVDRCCGCVGLRNGTYFVGLFWTIFTAVFFSTNVAAAASNEADEAVGYALLATISGLLLISCLLLLYGVYEERLMLIKTWVVVFALLAVANAAAIPTAAICFLHWNLVTVICALLATCVGVVIVIYCLIVVNSYYRDLSEARAALEIPFYGVTDDSGSPYPMPRY